MSKGEIMEKEIVEKKEEKNLFEIRKLFDERVSSASLNNELEFVYTSIAYCLKNKELTKKEANAIVDSLNLLAQGVKEVISKCEIKA